MGSARMKSLSRLASWSRGRRKLPGRGAPRQLDRLRQHIAPAILSAFEGAAPPPSPGPPGFSEESPCREPSPPRSRCGRPRPTRRSTGASGACCVRRSRKSGAPRARPRPPRPTIRPRSCSTAPVASASFTRTPRLGRRAGSANRVKAKKEEGGRENGEARSEKGGPVCERSPPPRFSLLATSSDGGQLRAAALAIPLRRAIHRAALAALEGLHRRLGGALLSLGGARGVRGARGARAARGLRRGRGGVRRHRPEERELIRLPRRGGGGGGR